MNLPIQPIPDEIRNRLPMELLMAARNTIVDMVQRGHGKWNIQEIERFCRDMDRAEAEMIYLYHCLGLTSYIDSIHTDFDDGAPCPV